MEFKVRSERVLLLIWLILLQLLPIEQMQLQTRAYSNQETS